VCKLATRALTHTRNTPCQKADRTGCNTGVLARKRGHPPRRGRRRGAPRRRVGRRARATTAATACNTGTRCPAPVVRPTGFRRCDARGVPNEGWVRRRAGGQDWHWAAGRATADRRIRCRCAISSSSKPLGARPVWPWLPRKLSCLRLRRSRALWTTLPCPASRPPLPHGHFHASWRPQSPTRRQPRRGLCSNNGQVAAAGDPRAAEWRAPGRPFLGPRRGRPRRARVCACVGLADDRGGTARADGLGWPDAVHGRPGCGVEEACRVVSEKTVQLCRVLPHPREARAHARCGNSGGVAATTGVVGSRAGGVTKPRRFGAGGRGEPARTREHEARRPSGCGRAGRGGPEGGSAGESAVDYQEPVPLSTRDRKTGGCTSRGEKICDLMATRQS